MVCSNWPSADLFAKRSGCLERERGGIVGTVRVWHSCGLDGQVYKTSAHKLISLPFASLRVPPQCPTHGLTLVAKMCLTQLRT